MEAYLNDIPKYLSKKLEVYSLNDRFQKEISDIGKKLPGPPLNVKLK